MDLASIQWQWGTITAGFGSVLTGASLLIAAMTFRQARVDRRRAQADQFAVWLSRDPQGDLWLNAKNASTLPVREVRLSLRSKADPSQPAVDFQLPIVPPDTIEQRLVSQSIQDPLIEGWELLDASGTFWQSSNHAQATRGQRGLK